LNGRSRLGPDIRLRRSNYGAGGQRSFEMQCLERLQYLLNRLLDSDRQGRTVSLLLWPIANRRKRPEAVHRRNGKLTHRHAIPLAGGLLRQPDRMRTLSGASEVAPPADPTSEVHTGSAGPQTGEFHPHNKALPSARLVVQAGDSN
jgi:hypothetical protein